MNSQKIAAQICDHLNLYGPDKSKNDRLVEEVQAIIDTDRIFAPSEYVLLKELNGEIATIRLYSKEELLKHLQAMWSYTEWNLISVVRVK